MTKCICGAKATTELTYASGPDSYAVLDVCEEHLAYDVPTLLAATRLDTPRSAKQFLDVVAGLSGVLQVMSADIANVQSADRRK